MAAQQFLGNAPDMVGLFIVLGVFMLAGAAVSKDRTPLLLVICGWALSVTASILIALVGIRSLTVVLAFMLLLAGLGAWRVRSRPVDTRMLLPSVLLGAPLLALSAIVPSTYYDAFLHWLPNASYLVQANHLIAAPLEPGFYSLHPTYPPALALPVYFASRLSGHFAPGAAQVLTGALLVLATQHIALAVAPDTRGAGARPDGWLSVLLVFLALVLLNPTIHSFSAWPPVNSLEFWSVQADSTIAVLVVTAVAAMAEALGSDPHRGKAKAAAVSEVPVLASLGVLISTLKPNGIAIVVVLIASVSIIALLGRLGVRRAAVLVPFAVGAVAAATLWQGYLARFLPVGDVVGFRVLEHWRFHLLPEFLRSCLGVLRSNLLFYLSGGVALIVGLRAVVARNRRPPNVLELALAISGLALLGHLASLVVAYLSAGLEDWAIKQAFSWQRYASQVGLAASTAALLALGLLIRNRLRWPVGTGKSTVAVVLLAAALAYIPLAFSAKGYMLLYLQHREEPHRLGLQALAEIPPGTRVGVLGGDWALIYMRYSAWAELNSAQRPRVVDAQRLGFAEEREVLPLFEKWIVDPGFDCVVLIDAVAFAPRVGLAAEPDQFWCKNDQHWHVLDLGRTELNQLER